MAVVGLPGFSAGGGMPISASSSATASGGSIGAFNFQPKGLPTWAIAAAAAVAMVLLLRR